MKLGIKISLITILVLLLGMGVSGAAVLTRSARRNREITVENYERQTEATAHAVGKELDYEPRAHFSDTTMIAYYQYVMQKYGASRYILLEKDRVVCNKTPFVLSNPKDERWQEPDGYSVIQKSDERFLLLVCRTVPVSGNEAFRLILVQDISSVYADIREQIVFFGMVYLVTAIVTAVLVFAVTGKVLSPLRELSQAAQDISDGRLERRARVTTRDEVGQLTTAFNKMAECIKHQVDALSAETQRQRQMLGSLAHEMKTPMTSIMGYADSLLHVNLKEEHKEQALRHIYEECRRLGRLGSKLMCLIGMYDNDSICKEAVTAAGLFAHVAQLEEPHLAAKKMTLSCACGSEQYVLDRDLFESLLINLIDNAVKAGTEGGSIFLTAACDRIVVRDEGCGIAKEEIPRVTEAFYMVDKARSRREGGSGLGLALCSRIAQLHDARLEIESTLGEGTTVSVVFTK